MEKQKNTRPSEKHPAIQNLRWFLKQYLENDRKHTLDGFALSMDMTPAELGRYLRGEHSPRKTTVGRWSKLLDVDTEYMLTIHFPEISYPFVRYSKGKQSGRHITKREVRQSYDDMKEEYVLMAQEGEVVYDEKIIELFDRHRI